MSMQQKPSSKRKLDLASMAEFPDHIIYLILLKLPAKSLIRFRSLSKSWKETIMSPSFAKQHMQYVKEATDALSFSVMSSVVSPNRSSVTGFFRYQISSTEYDRQTIRPVWMSGFMFDNNGFDLLPRVQSCDGLLCIPQLGSNVSTSFIHIWNPATGKHKKFPWPRLIDDKYENYHYSFMGFGYESSINDYKIVVFGGFHVGKIRAQVLLLKENTWRDVDLKTLPCLHHIRGLDQGLQSYVVTNHQSNVVTLNGDVYWIAVIQVHQSRHPSFGLLKFNLAEERFSLLHLPLETCNYLIHKRKLDTLNGSLFLFLCYTSKIDIWKLQGHETWCKVGIIPTMEYGLAGTQQILHPIGFNVNGHIIIINRFDDSLFVYIPQEINKFVELYRAGNDRVTRPTFGFHFVHMDTLLSP